MEELTEDLLILLFRIEASKNSWKMNCILCDLITFSRVVQLECLGLIYTILQGEYYLCQLTNKGKNVVQTYTILEKINILQKHVGHEWLTSKFINQLPMEELPVLLVSNNLHIQTRAKERFIKLKYSGKKTKNSI